MSDRRKVGRLQAMLSVNPADDVHPAKAQSPAPVRSKVPAVMTGVELGDDPGASRRYYADRAAGRAIDYYAGSRRRSARAGADRTPLLPEAVLLDAVRGPGLRRAVFSRADLTAEIAARRPATGWSAHEVTARVEQLTDQALACTATVPLGESCSSITALPAARQTRASNGSS